MKEKEFEKITSYDIINKAMEEHDELCLKVVDKFVELLAVESSNLALKTLCYGGLYLIGGVTSGISKYLASHETFVKNFYQKGRLEGKMRQIPIYMIKDDNKVGLLGAKECAQRLQASFLQN